MNKIQHDSSSLARDYYNDQFSKTGHYNNHELEKTNCVEFCSQKCCFWHFATVINSIYTGFFLSIIIDHIYVTVPTVKLKLCLLRLNSCLIENFQICGKYSNFFEITGFRIFFGTFPVPNRFSRLLKNLL